MQYCTGIRSRGQQIVRGSVRAGFYQRLQSIVGHRDTLTGGKFYTDVKVECDKTHAGKFHLKARIRHQPVLPVLPVLPALSAVNHFTSTYLLSLSNTGVSTCVPLAAERSFTTDMRVMTLKPLSLFPLISTIAMFPVFPVFPVFFVGS